MNSIVEGQAKRASEVARQIAAVVRSDVGYIPENVYERLVNELDLTLQMHPEQTVITDDYIRILVCGEDDSGMVPDWVDILFPNISAVLVKFYT